MREQIATVCLVHKLTGEKKLYRFSSFGIHAGNLVLWDGQQRHYFDIVNDWNFIDCEASNFLAEVGVSKVENTISPSSAVGAAKVAAAS